MPCVQQKSNFVFAILMLYGGHCKSIELRVEFSPSKYCDGLLIFQLIVVVDPFNVTVQCQSILRVRSFYYYCG